MTKKIGLILAIFFIFSLMFSVYALSQTKYTNTFYNIGVKEGLSIKGLGGIYGINQLNLKFNSDMNRITITITKYETYPKETEKREENTYRYLEIEGENIGEHLNNVSGIFQVEDTWLSKKELSIGDIVIFKYVGFWKPIETKYTYKNNSWHYYNAELDGFGYYAIGEKSPVQENSLNNINNNLVVNISNSSPNVSKISLGEKDISYDLSNNTKKLLIGFSVFADIIAIIVLITVSRKNKSAKKQKEEI